MTMSDVHRKVAEKYIRLAEDAARVALAHIAAIQSDLAREQATELASAIAAVHRIVLDGR
jgi:hypothetical protein